MIQDTIKKAILPILIRRNIMWIEFRALTINMRTKHIPLYIQAAIKEIIYDSPLTCIPLLVEHMDFRDRTLRSISDKVITKQMLADEQDAMAELPPTEWKLARNKRGHTYHVSK